MLKASENVEEEDTIDSKHQIQKHYTLFGKQDGLHKETIDLGAQVEAENKKGDLVCKVKSPQLFEIIAPSTNAEGKKKLYRRPTTQSNLKTLIDFDKGKQDGLHKETGDLGAQVEADNKKGDLLSKDE
ncbi:uncharacterized protein G2W53_015423 [Senna tora]|uniref:Uncharacterized protein n=1 Tax=Senna tora TaxID=362788 RepID=A0A834WUS0_9FABA|nr:uncharacterized protein G2W53_015423 [Senna tora]